MVASTGAALQHISSGLYETVVPGLLNWTGDGLVIALAGAGGVLFIAAQVCAVVICFQGAARGKWQ
jgi:hypothetical protein